MIVTWNVANITRGASKEIAIHQLLVKNKVDVAALTEAELPQTTAKEYALQGYSAFFPPVSDRGKLRLMLLIRTDLASYARVRTDLPAIPIAVWVELALPGRPHLLVGAVYRTWSTPSTERADLMDLLDGIRLATEKCKSVLLLGDFNLDVTRSNDPTYNRRVLLRELQGAMTSVGLVHHPTGATWTSYGLFNGNRRSSCLDLVFTSSSVRANVSVLTDATTDHRPVLVTIPLSSRTQPGLKLLSRRNLKAIRREALCAALDGQDWDTLHAEWNPDAAYSLLVNAITAALDEVAPVRTFRVHPDRPPLYLSSETLAMMDKRDAAAAAGLPIYKQLRNRVTALTRRDRLQSNLTRLTEAGSDPRIMWSLAKEALGCGSSPPLPSKINFGSKSTTTDAEAAEAMGAFFIEKVDRLREGLMQPAATPVSLPSTPAASAFSFTFASAAKIKKIVGRLNNTGALGIDGIAVSVLKLGIDSLASPLAHIVNASLAAARVPAAMKVARVVPIHKGKGKHASSPTSYRPISILSPLSKVLEAVVKDDLVDYLKKTNALPNSQFGFRKERSTTAAIAAAHGSWVKAYQEGKFVGVLAFDYSSAFDTVDADTLVTKLKTLGIQGKESRWFSSYMEGGKQMVDWNLLCCPDQIWSQTRLPAWAYPLPCHGVRPPGCCWCWA